MTIASLYPVRLLTKNTFLHFNIEPFDVKARKRAASAPPRAPFSKKEDVLITGAKPRKRKRSAPKKINEDAVLNEFAKLARAESWGVFAKRLMERRERVEDRWAQLKCKLLTAAPIKKKKRFTITRRMFVNAAPWVDPVEMLRARKNEFLRSIEPDSMEFWASDADLISKKLAPIFAVLVLFRNLVERGQMIMMLPCGTAYVYAYRQDLHLDDLRAKVRDASSQPHDKLRLICQGQELKGSRVLGNFDVHPGDVIRVLFC